MGMKSLVLIVVGTLVVVMVALHSRPHHGGILSRMATAIHGHR